MRLYGLLFFIGVLLIYVLILYNKLISSNNRVKEAFSIMDVYLKKRWDLIPNLVETVKGYSKHESDTLKDIIDLRNKVYDDMSIDDKIKTNNNINSNIVKLLAIVEKYPELKASNNYLNLSNELVKIEDDIANSRKYYNANIRIYNNMLEVFPNNLIASLFKFKAYSMFNIKEEEKNNINIKM